MAAYRSRARHQAPSPVALTQHGCRCRPPKVNERWYAPAYRWRPKRGRRVLTGRKAGGRGGAGPHSWRPVHQDPPCCRYQNPAVRLWL